MALLSKFIQLIKTGLEHVTETNSSQITCLPITQVYAYPMGSLDGPSFYESSEGEQFFKNKVKQKEELNRIHRKHWFDILMGVSLGRIYAEHNRNEFGELQK